MCCFGVCGVIMFFRFLPVLPRSVHSTPSIASRWFGCRTTCARAPKVLRAFGRCSCRSLACSVHEFHEYIVVIVTFLRFPSSRSLSLLFSPSPMFARLLGRVLYALRHKTLQFGAFCEGSVCLSCFRCSFMYLPCAESSTRSLYHDSKPAMDDRA